MYIYKQKEKDYNKKDKRPTGSQIILLTRYKGILIDVIEEHFQISNFMSKC